MGNTYSVYVAFAIINEVRRALMKQLNTKYPSLSDIDIDFEPELECTPKCLSDDKSYTFDTHPFYSQLNIGDIEIPDDVDEATDASKGV